jgi:hypothetical protein
VEDHGRDALSSVLAKMLERVLNESEKKPARLTASEHYNHLVEVAADSGYTLSRDFDIQDSWTVDGVADDHRFSEHYEDKSTVDLDSIEVNNSQKWLAVVLGERHANRYTFDVTDPEQQTCVVQGNGSKQRPPIEVINKMNATGYEIENINVPRVIDSKAKHLDGVADLLNDIIESYDKNTTTHDLLNVGRSAINDAAAVLACREAMDSAEYLITLNRAVNTLSPQAASELESRFCLRGLENFLLNYYTDFVAPDQKQKIVRVCKQRDII